MRTGKVHIVGAGLAGLLMNRVLRLNGIATEMYDAAKDPKVNKHLSVLRFKSGSLLLNCNIPVVDKQVQRGIVFMDAHDGTTNEDFSRNYATKVTQGYSAKGRSIDDLLYHEGAGVSHRFYSPYMYRLLRASANVQWETPTSVISELVHDKQKNVIWTAPLPELFKTMGERPPKELYFVNLMLLSTLDIKDSQNDPRKYDQTWYVPNPHNCVSRAHLFYEEKFVPRIVAEVPLDLCSADRKKVRDTSCLSTINRASEDFRALSSKIGLELGDLELSFMTPKFMTPTNYEPIHHFLSNYMSAEYNTMCFGRSAVWTSTVMLEDVIEAARDYIVGMGYPDILNNMRSNGRKNG